MPEHSSASTARAHCIERGYVRPEDEPAVPQSEPTLDRAGSDSVEAGTVEHVNTVGSGSVADDPEEDDGPKTIPDRLLTELTAYRTLALRDALAQDPVVANHAALHAFCLKLFYQYTTESCLEIDVKSVVFGSQAPGLNDTAITKVVDERHRNWSEQLPREAGDLWDALLVFDPDSRDALFAHCVALSVNAVHETWNRRPRALAHADRIAEAVGLDVAAVGWSPTVDNYFGRVTKARILQAVQEAKGEQAVQLIGHLKKVEMAERAQELIAGSAWLPEPLRTPGRAVISPSRAPQTPAVSPIESSGEESAATGYETAIADPERPANDEPVATEPLADAAE